MEFILIYEICDFKGFRSKMTNELVSHCQTLSLRAVTVTYLFLLNVYLPYRHIFNKSSVLSTLPLLGIWWYKARVCVCVCVYVCALCRVWPFVAPWTAGCQAPLSMKFSRQEYWSGLPFPIPGDLPDPGIEPVFLVSLALVAGFFTTSNILEAHMAHSRYSINIGWINEWKVGKLHRGSLHTILLKYNLDLESNDIHSMGSIVWKPVLLSIFALLKSFAFVHLISFSTSQSRTAIGGDWHSEGEVKATAFHTSYLVF